MHRRTRIAAAAAATTFALAGLAAPAGAKRHHTSHWTGAQCFNAFTHWQSTHRHATARQTHAEVTKLDRQHGCHIQVQTQG